MRDIPLPRNLILLPLLLRCTSHPQLSDITTQRPGTGESTARTPWRDLHTPQITNNRARLVEWLSTSTAIITSAITYSRPARAARHRESIGRSSQPKADQRLLRLELPSSYQRIEVTRYSTLCNRLFNQPVHETLNYPASNLDRAIICLSDHCDQRDCCEPLGSKQPVNSLGHQSPAEHQAIRYPFRRSPAWRPTDCLH